MTDEPDTSGAPTPTAGELTKPHRATRVIEYAADSPEDLARQLDLSLADGLYRPGGVEIFVRTVR